MDLIKNKERVSDIQRIYKLMDFLCINNPMINNECELKNKKNNKNEDKEKITQSGNLNLPKIKSEYIWLPIPIKSQRLLHENTETRAKSQISIKYRPKNIENYPKISYRLYNIPIVNNTNKNPLANSWKNKEKNHKNAYDINKIQENNHMINIFRNRFLNQHTKNNIIKDNNKIIEKQTDDIKLIKNSTIVPKKRVLSTIKEREKDKNYDDFTLAAWNNDV